MEHHIEMKLTITELKQIIKEEILSEKEAAVDSETVTWEMPYAQFVKSLGAAASDPKVIAFLAGGQEDGDPKDDVFSSTRAAIPVTSLRPTQNEVDIDKSLAFPITHPKDFVNLVVNTTHTIVGPIVTFNGKYVIDGHHRWSSLYCCNSDAKIDAINISIAGAKPLDVLKAMQVSIAKETGKVRTQSVEGSNLFKMSRDEIEFFIKDRGTDTLYDVINATAAAKKKIQAVEGQKPRFLQADIPIEEKLSAAAPPIFKELEAQLVSYIWNNVTILQRASQPVAGAGPRDFMPQTDDVDWQPSLTKGEIDISHPHVAESKDKSREELIAERLQKLAGLIKG